MATDPGIFKAYDIRGLYGEQIDEDVAYRLGRAFARVLSDLESKPVADLRVGVGRDMRLTAPSLLERYTAGLRDEGVSVLDAGLVGTEMLYYLVGSRELDGGLMCTASHNPKTYTGAKLVRGTERCRCRATRASATCATWPTPTSATRPIRAVRTRRSTSTPASKRRPPSSST